MSEAVVLRALLFIREHAVSLGRFLELLFRIGVARIFVRVIFHRELAVRLLDLVDARAFREAEHFVVIAFFGRCHRHFCGVGVSPGAADLLGV